MRFKLPENLSKLSIDELNALHAEALAESVEINGIADDEITDEQITDLEALADALDTISAEQGVRSDKAARLAATRSKIAAADEAASTEDDDDDSDEDDADDADEDLDAEAERLLEEEKNAVTASARRRGAVAKTASKAKTPEIPEGDDFESGAGTLVAAANVPGYESGAALPDMMEVSKAFMARSRGFQGSTAVDRFDRYGVVKIEKPKNEFDLNGMSTEEAMETIMAAADESRLPKGGLVAAGGWCAPSETLYGFCSLETISGILSIPEVTWSRGGINFTKGPDYSTLAATWGFLQTEAQAEAGTPKVCYDLVCPPFTEVRLDAIGFCVTAPLLTNAAYPELVRRVLEIGLTAHAHKVNASVISRISTLIGAATNFAEYGGAGADVLDALALQASVLRYQYAMDPNATLEVILPIWAKDILRSDFSRRTGVDMLGITDQQINTWFGVRNLAVQFVYDYQPIATGNTAAFTKWPTTLEAMIYPAGAYVKGTTSVIDLDTVYDSAGLTVNEYTAAFFEEGLAVANTCGSGRKVSIDITCLKGNTGAAELTCVAP